MSNAWCPSLCSGHPVTGRRLVVSVAVVVLVATAGCGPASASQTGGTTPTPSQTAVPWLGTFTSVTLPPTVQELRSVTCPTTTTCWAVGSMQGLGNAPSSATVVTTVDGGAKWRVRPFPAIVGFLAGIACTGTRACTVVGQVGSSGTGPGAVVTTDDSGATWTLQPVPTGTTDVTAIECGSGDSCIALADVAGRVTSLSRSGPAAPWVAGGALPPTVSAGTGISCTEATLCWATGVGPATVGHLTGVVATTSDGGATWTLQPIPPGLGALQDVSCTSTGGQASPATTTPSTVPGSRTTSSPVAAAPTTSSTLPGSGVDCTAVGTTSTVIGASRAGQAVVITTSDGGLTWSSDPVTATGADLLSVSCRTGPCVAVGSTVASVPQAGLIVLTGSSGAAAHRWDKAAVVKVGLPLAGIDCGSLSSCVAVGESISAHLSSS